MFKLGVLFSLLYGSPSFAHGVDAHAPTLIVCDGLLGRSHDQGVSLGRVRQTFEDHTDVRTIYRSDDPDANLIIVVSRYREARARVVREVAGCLNVPIFLPEGETRAGANDAPAGLRPALSPGLFNAFAMVDDVGNLPARYWSAGNTFFGFTDPRRKLEYACRHDAVVTTALMQSYFEWGEWAERPLPTLLDNVVKESHINLSVPALRRLAAIYYVGRPQEVLED